MEEDAITSQLFIHNSKKMYAFYSQENMSQAHSEMMMANSLESEVKRVWLKQENIESGGEKSVQESQPGASSELVIDIQLLAEQSRRMGSRKASANFRRHVLDSGEQLKFSMEESRNGLQELVIGVRVSTEWKNSCEPIQESRTKLQSALVTGSESCRLTSDKSTPQPVQETGHHTSTKLVAELSSTLQTESCRHTVDESALQAVQETNFHASSKLVAGTIELSSAEDYYKGDPGS